MSEAGWRDPLALRGAAMVAIVFSATAVLIGTSQYAFGLFIGPLEQTFGWSRTEVSASLSFAAVSGLAAPWLGRLMDRIGAGPVLALCLGLSAVSLLLRPLMTELWHWYALSFLQFVGFSGATMLPAGKLIAAWYPHSRGKAMGIALMGNNFGGLTVPFLVTALLAAFSWRETYLALGALALAVVALSLLVVRESPAHARRGTHGEPAPQAARAAAGLSRAEAVRLPAFYAVLLVLMFGTFTYSTVLPHVLAHLVNRGFSTELASAALGGLAIGGLLGKLAFGALCDRLGARLTVAINLAGQALFAAALAYLPGNAGPMLAAPLFGFFMGGFGVLNSLLVQDAFGLREFGAIMGLVNAGSVVSFGLGPVLAGLSFDLTGGYEAAFMLTAALFAAAATVLLLVRLPDWRPAPEPT